MPFRNFIARCREKAEKKLLQEKIKEGASQGNPCCSIAYPIKQAYETLEKENQKYVIADLLLSGHDIAIVGIPFEKSEIFGKVVSDIEGDPELKDYERIGREINLGGGADWIHGLVSWVADNDLLRATSNLSPTVAVGIWLKNKIFKFKESTPKEGSVRIGPASARTLAITELVNLGGITEVKVMLEYEAISNKQHEDRHYLFFLEAKSEEGNELGVGAHKYYVARISWDMEVIKLTKV